jgi:hypothetical protein
MTDVTADSDLSLAMMCLDWPSQVATFYRSDGATATLKLQPRDLPDSSRLRRTWWSPVLHAFLAETTEGDAIAMELPSSDCIDQLDGRSIVYLDQGIWRRITDATFSPHGIRNEAELSAAKTLISLVDDRRIILPLSAGHHAETTRWGNDVRRYQLGLTMLRLSRGWQMRDPLAVRRGELRGALLRHVRAEPLAPTPPVFTLESNATSLGVAPINAPADFNKSQAATLQALTYFSTIVAVILDPDRIEPTKEEIGWVKHNQEFSGWLDGETGRDRAQKRASVDALLFGDLSSEIAVEAHAAGLSPSQMSSWTRGPMFKDIGNLPSLGIYRSVLQDRHLNIGTRWTRNDLTDMIYLSCAVGYADVVVAERHMTTMLRQAQRRLGRPVSVYSSLTDALPAVTDLMGQPSQSEGATVSGEGNPPVGRSLGHDVGSSRSVQRSGTLT